MVYFFHFVAYALACTPSNAYALILSAYLSATALSTICAPIDENRGSKVFNFDSLLYMAGI
jgi:hypothetical protein